LGSAMQMTFSNLSLNRDDRKNVRFLNENGER